MGVKFFFFYRDFTTLGLTYRKREVKKELTELEVGWRKKKRRRDAEGAGPLTAEKETASLFCECGRQA